jgi:hypothetical protein
MKKEKRELEVDVIGGQGSLTKEEELAISKYLESKKVKEKGKKAIPKSRSKSVNPMINS